MQEVSTPLPLCTLDISLVSECLEPVKTQSWLEPALDSPSGPGALPLHVGLGALVGRTLDQEVPLCCTGFSPAQSKGNLIFPFSLGLALSGSLELRL